MSRFADEGSEPNPSFGVVDWTELPTDERRCLRWMLRTGEVGAHEAAEEMEITEDEAFVILEALVERQLAIRVEERVIYIGNVGRRTARFKPGGLWDDLSQKLMDES